MRADKEEIRARSDIVEVIGRVVTLRKRGRNWQGLCPFHQEKTASFNVDPVTQTFKCFGCDASGDVFSFTERYENMSFVEAAEFLARRAGLTFDRGGSGGRSGVGASERERIYQINAEAASYFQANLARSGDARDYVARRGLSDETVKLFQIGYAPDRWDGLVGHLEVRKYDLRVAATAGLASVGSDGHFLDVFRGRLMFPIHDEQERVVGFGGRALGDELPKYKNTSETPVFTKSRLLYGLPYARRHIAEDGRALLMEGYMDVVAVHQAGFLTALATLGTALSEDHARKLARLVPSNPTVVLVYDGDSAGVKATMRASETLEREGVEVRVVVLPEGDDPDSMVRSGRADVFRGLVDNAVGRVTYQLDRVAAAADRSTEDGRAKLLRQIVAVLASVPSRSERDAYVERVWHYHPMGASGPAVAKEQLHRDAEAYAAQHPPTGSGQPAATIRAGSSASSPSPGRRSGASTTSQGVKVAPTGAASAPVPSSAGKARTAAERAEREMIRALTEPDWFQIVLERADDEDFATPLGRHLLGFAREHRQALASGQADILTLVSQSQDDEFAANLREFMQEFRASPANAPLSDEVVVDCLSRLRRARVARLKDDLARLMRSKPSALLTDEDRENVRVHQELLSQLLTDPAA